MEPSEVKPVRVQATEDVVRRWGVNWTDDDAVKAAFRDRRLAYLESAATATDTLQPHRVYDVP